MSSTRNNQSLSKKKSHRKKMRYNLIEYMGITIIFTALNRRVVIDFNNICILVIIFYINAVKSSSDCIRSINPQPYDMGWHLIGSDTFNPAIDKMPVYRCLYLEGIRGDRVFTHIQQPASQHPDPPVGTLSGVTLSTPQ